MFVHYRQAQLYVNIYMAALPVSIFNDLMTLKQKTKNNTEIQYSVPLVTQFAKRNHILCFFPYKGLFTYIAETTYLQNQVSK